MPKPPFAGAKIQVKGLISKEWAVQLWARFWEQRGARTSALDKQKEQELDSTQYLEETSPLDQVLPAKVGVCHLKVELLFQL